MDSAPATGKDDILTVIAIAALACILQDILHEGLGHGLTAWLSGAHRITISTVAMQAEIDSRWIEANGTLVNLVFGAIFWLLLRNSSRFAPATRFFLVLALAGNLFTGTGYFFFSGVTNFGDWAGVIRGLEPHWLWRVGLIAVGMASYYGSMLLVAAELKAFHRQDAPSRRIRGLTWTPYAADGVLAALAGLLNPAGLFYVLASALPSTLGANSGMLSLPSMVSGMIRRERKSEHVAVAPITRNAGLIAAAALASLLFIVVVGRGVTWSR